MRPAPERFEQPAGDSIAASARLVVADLTTGRRPDQGALATVALHLRRYVQNVFRELDPDDIVQTTLIRLLARPDGLARTEIDNEWAYLVGATRNTALDALRARQRRQEVALDAAPERPEPDDPIAAMLDRDASRTTVVDAMRQLLAEGDDQTVRIITTWLDMADELGVAPSTRDAAKRIGVSHTSVATALKRFREAIVAAD
jgi:RNA polymerase sigma factor (sigma-70 family)